MEPKREMEKDYSTHSARDPMQGLQRESQDSLDIHIYLA